MNRGVLYKDKKILGIGHPFHSLKVVFSLNQIFNQFLTENQEENEILKAY